MIKHQYNTPTKYEFAFKTSDGKTVYTMWMINKSFVKAVKFAMEIVNDLISKTNTDGSWEYNTENKTIFNTRSNIVGKFTGRTLYEVNGTYAR